jgi:hypothetical protein
VPNPSAPDRLKARPPLGAVKRRLLAGVLLVGLAASSTRADPGPGPWTPARAVPLPRWATSVTITRPEEPLYTEPSKAAAKRGAADRGATLPLFAARRGPGCEGRWLMVGPLAWVCEQGAELRAGPAPEAGTATLSADGLPFRYHFVGADGSFGYLGLQFAEEGVPDTQLLPKFGVALVRTDKKSSTGEPFGLTSHGYWVPMRDLIPVDPSDFRGALLDGDLNVAWVTAEQAAVHDRPGGRRGHRRIGRLAQLAVLETAERAGQRWLRISEREWVNGRDVRGPAPAPPPAEAKPFERWIDVDLERQVLTAYVGDKPVFATLVSTGRGPENSELATPKGAHRIWVKLRASDMDNLENAQALENYAIQSVPWVMYFKKGYGLHGTFWHRAFGRVQSHGCVNLSPRDAERLFYWTSPRLPQGWSAAFPTPYEPGTLIRVR